MKKVLLKCIFIIIILVGYIILNENIHEKNYVNEIVLESDSITSYDWECIVNDEFLNISKEEKNGKYIFKLSAKKSGITEVQCVYSSSLNNNDSDVVKVYSVQIDSRKKITINDPKDYKEFKFDTAYGNVKIVANNALTATGFAGSSNTIFYLKDNNLYLYVNNGDDDLLAVGVDNMYYENNNSQVITVKLNKNSNIIKNLPYINYVYDN